MALREVGVKNLPCAVSSAELVSLELRLDLRLRPWLTTWPAPAGRRLMTMYLCAGRPEAGALDSSEC